MPLSPAEKQARYRAKLEVAFRDADQMLAEFFNAIDRGRSTKVMDNDLPEERAARYQEVTRRLKGLRLIATPMEPGSVSEALNTIAPFPGSPTGATTRWERKKAERERLRARVAKMSPQRRALLAHLIGEVNS